MVLWWWNQRQKCTAILLSLSGREVGTRQLLSVCCSLILRSEWQGNKKTTSSSRLSFLCTFDYKNEKIMDLLQRQDSFSFILSCLLVVKVRQMFSIVHRECQTMRETSARNLRGEKGTSLPLSDGCGPRRSWQLKGLAAPKQGFVPLNLQLFVWSVYRWIIGSSAGSPSLRIDGGLCDPAR